MFNIEIYGGSDRGLVRENNEDSIGYMLFDSANVAVALVADGVGGHAGGEVASAITVEVIKEQVRKSVLQATSGGGYSEHWLEQVLNNSFAHANKEIKNQQALDKSLEGMATTIVAALIKDDQISIAHVGDSRCYLWRDKKLIQITKDHTVAQEMVDSGALDEQQAKSHPYSHVLSQAIGLERVLDIDIQRYVFNTNDMYLLCSDGLTNCLNDEEIAKVLIECTDIQMCADELIIRANDNGGVDNISVVLVSNVC